MPELRHILLIPILLGLAGVCIFGYYAIVDWNALQIAYVHFEAIAQHATDLRTLTVADSEQNIHRINLFADGAWTLLSAILSTVAFTGFLKKRS